MPSRIPYRVLFLFLSLLPAACNKADANLMASSATVQQRTINATAASHAAQKLNDKYKILSRAESKELEWRNALLIDRLNPPSSPQKEISFLLKFNATVRSIVSEKEADQCATCHDFVLHQLSASRVTLPEAFTATKLVTYDVTMLPSMYLATIILKQCHSPKAPDLSLQMENIERFLVKNAYATQDAMNDMKTQSRVPPNLSCNDPRLAEWNAISAHRIARLTDNIAFNQEVNPVH